MKTKDEAHALAWLLSKFPAEEYAVLPHVPDGTGAHKRRTIDALIMSLWPSRGLKLWAVEYKRSLHDWKRELSNPVKAEGIASYCHYYYVLAPQGIIPPETIPAGWGFWEIDDRDRMLTTKAAPEKPEGERRPLDYVFLAGILRRSSDEVWRDPRVSEARRQGFEDGKKSARDASAHEIKRYKDQLANVEAFEKASGIHVADTWNGEQLGRETRQLLEMLAKPEASHYRAEQLLRTGFELYRAALNAARALGIAEDKIAAQLREVGS